MEPYGSRRTSHGRTHLGPTFVTNRFGVAKRRCTRPRGYNPLSRAGSTQCFHTFTLAPMILDGPLDSMTRYWLLSACRAALPATRIGIVLPLGGEFTKTAAR